MVQQKTSVDWGTVSLIGLGGVGAGVGLYLFLKKSPLKEGEPGELVITKYQNLRTGVTVEAPDVILAELLDIIRVTFEFKYFGPPVSGTYYMSLWHKTILDPHKEDGPPAVLDFNIPETKEITTYEVTLDLILTGLSEGEEYGIYVKITGTEGPDAFSPYYASIIKIGMSEMADIADFDFTIQSGTYDLGQTIPFSAIYKYLGAAQSGRLIISLGTGIYPTFSTVYTFSPMSISLPESSSWRDLQADGQITLPQSLTPGQTYSIRATIEGIDLPTQETDTDWSAFTIREGQQIPPTDIANWDFQCEQGYFRMGDTVPWQGSFSYKGKSQQGWLTISLGTGIAPSFFTVYTFLKQRVTFPEAYNWVSRNISGQFTLPGTLEEGQTYSIQVKLETDDGIQETDTDYGVITIEAQEQYQVTVRADPIIGGWIYQDPDKPYYNYGDIIVLTAYEVFGWTFTHFDIDGTVRTENPLTLLVAGNHIVTAHFIFG